METTTDPLGRTISLTDERWEQIVDGHPYMAPFRADVLRRSSQGDPARAVNFDETLQGHAVSFDENDDLVGLTLIDIRRLLNDGKGEFLLELPAKASPADLKLALA